MLKISGDLMKLNNGLESKYEVTKPGINSSIEVVEKFYEKKGKDRYFYSETYIGEDGKVVIEAESILGVDVANNITPEESSLKLKYISNDEEKCEDLISNRVILINPYSEDGNVRFYVAKNINNSEIQDLTFAFPTNVDYRQQLYNLYFGLISVKELDKQMLLLAGVDEQLIPEKIGMFDAFKFIENYSKSQVMMDSSKQLQKQAIKK